MMVFLTAILTWFSFGYAIAFGVNPDTTILALAGFTNGWFGDLSGGVDKSDIRIIPGSDITVADQTLIFNQRRFVVFFAFQIISSNIATGSIAERTKMSAIIGFVFIQQLIIIPILLCWCYARPMEGNETKEGLGFLYNLGFFDRAGFIPIVFAGAVSSLVGSAVIGPRYGVFMPDEDQKKIAGGGKDDAAKDGGLMSMLQFERDKAFEIDELYLYKVRKLIKRELT